MGDGVGGRDGGTVAINVGMGVGAGVGTGVGGRVALGRVGVGVVGVGVVGDGEGNGVGGCVQGMVSVSNVTGHAAPPF